MIVPYPCSIPGPGGEPAPPSRPFTVTADDHARLNVHRWDPPDSRPRGVVILFHGIGMHGEPYGAVARGFTGRGLSFLTPDLRGHGRSPGRRHTLCPFSRIRADFSALCAEATRRYPGIPLFLAGESMGGLLAAELALDPSHPLAGLLLFAPAFGIARARMKPSLRDVISLVRGEVALNADPFLREATHSAGFISSKRNDPWASPSISTLGLLRIALLQRHWPRAGARLRVPLYLALAGCDRIIRNAKAERVYAGVSTPEKSIRVWPEARHTVFWDPDTPSIVEECVDWLEERLTISGRG